MAATRKILIAAGIAATALNGAARPAGAEVAVNVTCAGYDGTAASFVTAIEIYTDGTLTATKPGAARFSGVLDLHGDHTVTVYDRTAGNDWDRDHDDTSHGGPDHNLVGTYHLSCPAAPTTTATPATTTTAASSSSTSDPQATIPQLVVDPTAPPAETVPVRQQQEQATSTVVVVNTAPVPSVVQTVATVQKPTGTTLPATGSNSTPLIAAGVVFVGAGSLALGASRRTQVR